MGSRPASTTGPRVIRPSGTTTCTCSRGMRAIICTGASRRSPRPSSGASTPSGCAPGSRALRRARSIRFGVLTPPRDLSEDMLAAALASGWDVGVDAMSYRPLGFGSHHWEVGDTRGARWFLTVDELESKQISRDESLDQTFARLRASLRAARDLRDCGAAFVVAPVPARDGEPSLRLGQQFGAALYPFVTGQSFEWGESPIRPTAVACSASWSPCTPPRPGPEGTPRPKTS